MAKGKIREFSRAEKDRASRIIKKLQKEYPEAECSLKYRNPFELLIAVVLSAQCTDKKVNAVLPSLFTKFPDAKRMAVANIRSLENAIKTLGLYRSKAKNIREIARITQGRVPDDMQELQALPGVGRKTSNVVLTEIFHRAEGIAVDTHCRRLSMRLGLTAFDDPIKIEKDLMNLFSQGKWHLVTHHFIAHGREVCKAPRPLCDTCILRSVCTYPKQQ
ncbi:MAG: endonuclease III [Candidatus Lindowbacteria bacterium]|nr:endonuclease III [Candidatus Lindowbacteria bacterium]